jgi:hypothetical protein
VRSHSLRSRSARASVRGSSPSLSFVGGLSFADVGFSPAFGFASCAGSGFASAAIACACSIAAASCSAIAASSASGKSALERRYASRPGSGRSSFCAASVAAYEPSSVSDVESMSEQTSFGMRSVEKFSSTRRGMSCDLIGASITIDANASTSARNGSCCTSAVARAPTPCCPRRMNSPRTTASIFAPWRLIAVSSACAAPSVWPGVTISQNQPSVPFCVEAWSARGPGAMKKLASFARRVARNSSKASRSVELALAGG